MPPSVESVILDHIAQFRAEVRADIKDLREAITGYDRARCDQHTERMAAIASRLDTFAAAQTALMEHRNATWGRMAQSFAIMAAVAALVTLGLRVVGL